MPFKKLALSIVVAASLSACGGGDTAANNSSNTLACTKPGNAQAVTPLDTVLRLFIAVYQLEAGQIDEFGAFIITSSIIFELAAANAATVNGNSQTITSTCYQATDKTLTLNFGQADVLTLSQGGKATGTINGKMVRSKTP